MVLGNANTPITNPSTKYNPLEYFEKSCFMKKHEKAWCENADKSLKRNTLNSDDDNSSDED